MKNISKLLFILVAVLTLMSGIHTLINGEVSVAAHILADIEIIILSLLVAFTSERNTVDEINDENE